MATLSDWRNQKLLTLVDKFVPASAQTDLHNKRRARVIVITLLFAVVFSSFMFILRCFQYGFVLSTAINLLTPIGSLYLIKVIATAKDINRVCDFGIVLITLLISGTALFDGGLHSRAMVWFPIMCIVSSFVGSRIGCCHIISYCGLFLITLLLLHTNQVYGSTFDSSAVIGKFASTFASCGFACMIAIAFEKARITDSEQLKREKENALMAMRHKSEFLANMSHEIRTPMNGVIGMLGLLSRSTLNGDQQAKLKVAQDSAESLLVIINDILDFSKIEAGKLKLEKIKFNLVDLLEDVAKSNAYRAQSKGLELILDFGELRYSTIEGDPSRLRQILNNLLSNAIKFTSHGEVILQCGMDNVDDSHCFYFKVQDSGIGIPASHLNRLFESFMQLDASTTRQFGGTGLGLAIVKQLAELMDGHVKVESREGEGSCFTVTLPMNVNKASRCEPVFTGPETKRIFIWDENKHFCKHFADQLIQQGMEVWTASTFKEARFLLDNHSIVPDCGLIDSKVAMKHGDYLSGLFDRGVGTDNTQWVLMRLIAEGDDEINYKIDVSKFQPVLTKPFSVFNFLEQFKYYLEKNKTKNPSERSEKSSERTCVNDLAKKQESVSRQIAEKPILLVEDNENNQQVLKGILKDFPITVANNGVEALRILRESMHKQTYSLVLMDCLMPEMNGFEATQKIRQGLAGDLYQSIPIIAITANVMVSDEKQCYASGMNDYLSKPVDADLLKTKVEYWLAKSEDEFLKTKPA